ncbi:MAG TPA: amylo-alpha-1,6-glucosidase [Thermoplasmata archaeon]|nr:amylo-alpha-1,6-glucosidase [Thermoplasmata archaeon]
MSDDRRSGTPVLLTSLSSAALLDGQGDLSSPRETRGALYDWGGVYGQLVRLTGPWRVELSRAGKTTGLPATLVDAETFPGGWRSRHRWEGVEVVQEVSAVESPPGAVRRLRFTTSSPEPLRLTVSSRVPPFLLPVLVEGVRPVTFDVAPQGASVYVRQHGFALRLSSSLTASRITMDGAPLPSSSHHGPVGEIRFDHDLEVVAGVTTELLWQVAGGLARDLEVAEREVGQPPVAPDASMAAGALADQQWLERTPVLDLPDAPELSRAYASARAALRRLYTAPGDGLVGLVAGYPWYSAIWCRDLAVMLPALLWLGDSEWVERSLNAVFRFQSRQAVQVLGGEPGELPMQVGPGPIFLYGTSDTTLRFPAVVEQFHRHAGDTGSLGEWGDALHRIVEWARARVDPATGLLRHGGEAEGIEMATAALSRVRYGIDSPDTTIWDSADRRDHGVDVQVLWCGTLRATDRLLREVGDTARASRCRGEADALEGTIARLYLRPDGHYLYDTLRGATPVEQVRPNALRAVSAGILDHATGMRVVERAADPDLTTAWGVRTLSSDDPGYDPMAYHAGQVWTIATAWAADAALSVGRADLGVEYLRTIGRRYEAEGGFANECYRGDRPEPFNSCYLLGFSVAPFLCVLFERLWGITLDALSGRVTVRPCFPASWTRARIDRLRVGAGHLSIDWSPERLSIRWSGTRPITVVGAGGEMVVQPGGTGELRGRPAGGQDAGTEPSRPAV